MVLFKTDLDNVEGIAVDWIGNNLFWTNDGYKKTINVARLQKASQSRKTLLEGAMSHPRGIVVDPVNGYGRWVMFFCFLFCTTQSIVKGYEEVKTFSHSCTVRSLSYVNKNLMGLREFDSVVHCGFSLKFEGGGLKIQNSHIKCYKIPI